MSWLKVLARGLPLGVGLAVTSAIAAAQTPPVGAQTTAAEEEALPEIVVTGSRIRKDEFTSASPIQIITAERSTLEGLSDTAQVLQQSTVASGSGQINSTFSGFVVDGGPGVQTLSIRGLGAQRTLVLLNGRRLPPAGTGGTVGPVDLNIIPDSIISRIELLKDGASSIYGSDAVAGVANIITRTRTNGGQIGGQINSITGGGDQYTVDGTYGWSGDRGGASISFEWYRRTKLTAGERDFSACPQDNVFAAQAGNVGAVSLYGIPARHVEVGDRTDAIDLRTGKYKCWSGNGDITGLLVDYSLGLNLTNAPPLPGYNPAFLNDPVAGWRRSALQERVYDSPEDLKESLIPYANRLTLFAQGDYSLGGSAEIYTELLATERKSDQVARRNFFPDISPDTPINPVAGDYVRPLVILPFDAAQDVKVWRALAGIRGDVSAGFLDNWHYDVYASHSHNDANYSRIVIPYDHVEAATGTLQDGSFEYTGAVCPPGSPAGCVPFTDLFTVAGLQNSQYSAAQLAYMLATDTGKTKYDQSILEAQITGDLFDLPAGSVGAAFGATVRRDKINDVPGEYSQNANSWGSITAGITKGKDTVKEVYTEFEVPLLRGAPMVQDLSLNLSGRYSDYDSVGDAFTYKAGLNWKINDLLRLRSTYGTSFRAPALYELYLANQVSFLGQSSVDPCILWGDAGRPKPQTIQDNCAADGIPPDFAGGASGAEIVTGGGLGRLKPEDSNALSVGLVVTPPGSGFSVAVDYFDIKVKNQVGSFALGVVGACYADPRFRTIPGFCDLFERDLDPDSPDQFSILSVDASYRNIPTQRTKGFDLNASFEHDLSFGKLEIEGETTRTTYDKTELFLGRVQDYNGLVGEPKWVADVQTRLRRGDWTFTWTVNYTGKGDNFGYEEEEGEVELSYSGPSTIITGVKEIFTHDISVRYQTEKYEVIGGVSNLLDKQPPVVSYSDAPGSVLRIGNAPLSSQYLSLYEGRGVFLSLNRKF